MFLLVFLVRNKKLEVFRILIPILCSDVVFVVFNCLFQTVNHARYIDTHIVALNLIVIVALAALENRALKYSIAIVLIGIMLISNYRTVDPVTLHLFEKHDVGETVIVSTIRGEYLSDSIVYNQQYMCLDKVLNKALEDIVSRENTVICFPTLNDNSWFFDGIGDWDSAKNGILVKEEYWDLKRKKRIAYETEECISISIVQLSEQSDLREIIGDKVGYFFYLPEVGDNIYKNIAENMCVMEEEVFEHQGWNISRIKFSN